MTDDRRFRELFRSARRLDEQRAPRFREFLRRGSPKQRTVRIPLVARLAALAIVVTLVGVLAIRPGADRPAGAPDATGELLSSGTWSAPTDFLLATPGSDLLHSVPHIGAPLPFGNAGSQSKKGIRT